MYGVNEELQFVLSWFPIFIYLRRQMKKSEDQQGKLICETLKKIMKQKECNLLAPVVAFLGAIYVEEEIIDLDNNIRTKAISLK